MKLTLKLLTLLIASLCFTGCDYFLSTKLRWNSSQRDITYTLTQQQVDNNGALTTPVTEDITLSFGSTRGDVDLIYDSVITASKLAINGTLRPVDPTESYFFWESMFLSILPPDGKVRENKTWTVKRPSDLEVQNSDGLIAQSEITYKVVSVSPYMVEYSGNMKIASTQALDDLAANYGLPAVLVRAAANKAKPFLKGTAEFSETEGNTLKAKGIVRPFAALGNDTDLSDHPARIEYLIVKK